MPQSPVIGASGEPTRDDLENLWRFRPRGEIGSRVESLLSQLPDAFRDAVLTTWALAGQSPGSGETWRIWVAPGAGAGHHHGWEGGLILHSVEVAEIALMLVKQQVFTQEPSASLVIAGALLHDIGKTLTYSWGTVRETEHEIFWARRNKVGRQLTHIEVGEHLWQRAWRGTGSQWQHQWTTEEAESIRHIIRSHHGVPVPPKTVEALCVHLGDTASASLSMIQMWQSPSRRGLVGGTVGLGSTWRMLMARGKRLIRRL